MSKIAVLVAWLRSRPKRVSVPIVLLILALVAFGGFKAIEGYSYMENNPNFCRACHTMEEAWDRWQTSEHRSVNCHDCHQATLIEDAMLLLKFSLSRPDDVDKHAVVNDEACEKCHESGNPRWIQVAATAGHRVHAEEGNIACIKCHAVTVHRFTPPGAICLICHEEKHIEVSGMADMHCTACHEFLNGEEQLHPTREGCLNCHLALTELGVTWPEDAPMQYPCGDCHHPHEQAKPTVDCLSCHADTPSQGLHAGVVHAATTCQTCHAPHEWRSQGREGCLTCHADRVEHYVEAECATCHGFAEPASISAPGGPTPTPVVQGTPTPEGTGTPVNAAAITHSLEARDNCVMCHMVGAAGVGEPGGLGQPQDHAAYTNEMCLGCHQEQ